MGIEMLTHRIGCSYKSLSNNLAPEPSDVSSVRQKIMPLFVSVKGLPILNDSFRFLL